MLGENESFESWAMLFGARALLALRSDPVGRRIRASVTVVRVVPQVAAAMQR